MSIEAANANRLQATRDNQNNKEIERRMLKRQIKLVDMWTAGKESKISPLELYLMSRSLFEIAKVVGEIKCSRCPSPSSYYYSGCFNNEPADFKWIFESSSYEKYQYPKIVSAKFWSNSFFEGPSHIRHTECLVCEDRLPMAEREIYRDFCGCYLTHVYEYAGERYSFIDRNICRCPYY